MQRMSPEEFWRERTPLLIKVFVIGGGAVCLLMGLITLFSLGILGALDALIMLGLGYGIIWRRSRACAVAGAVYYALNQLMLRLLPLPSGQTAFASVVAYILIGLLILSIYGTFTYRSQYEAFLSRNALPPSNGTDSFN